MYEKNSTTSLRVGEALDISEALNLGAHAAGNAIQKPLFLRDHDAWTYDGFLAYLRHSIPRGRPCFRGLRLLLNVK